MKFYKLFLFPALVILMGCASLGNEQTKNDKMIVLSTTVMVGDVVAHIGGDKIISTILIDRRLDPHSYEFVKGDDEKLEEAGLIFYNGLGLEHGGSVRRFLEKTPRAIALGNAIARQRKEALIYIKQVVDPHIWMDVALWKEIIPVIVQALAEKDPAHSAYFEERGKELTARYEELHQSILEKMADIPEERRYLITSHDAFNYFTKAYLSPDWQEHVFAPEGLAPDGQISFHELRSIIQEIKKHDIQVLFPEAYVSIAPLKKIQEGASLEGFEVHLSEKPLYSDSLPEKGGYETMISYNAGVIYEQLAR